MGTRHPLLPWTACETRLMLLRALVAFAEGAVGSVLPPRNNTAAAAALSDVRLHVMGGRSGMRRSCGSVLAASVVRFLGGGLGPAAAAHITTVPAPHTWFTVTRDGKHVVVTQNDLTDTEVNNNRWFARTDALTDPAAIKWFVRSVRVYDVASGALVRCVRRSALRHKAAQLATPSTFGPLTTGPDGHIYVVDRSNGVVIVLSTELEFCAVFGDGDLGAHSACAADDAYVVCSNATRSQRAFVTYAAHPFTRVAAFGDFECTSISLLPGNWGFAALHGAGQSIRLYSVVGESLGVIRVPWWACGIDGAAGMAWSAFGELLLLSTDVMLVQHSGAAAFKRFRSPGAPYSHYLGPTTCVLRDGSVAVSGRVSGCMHPQAVVMFHAQ